MIKGYQTIFEIISYGKFHCMIDLVFYLFEFSCFAYVELTKYFLVGHIGCQPYSDDGFPYEVRYLELKRYLG